MSLVLDGAKRLRRKLGELRHGQTGYRVGRDLVGTSLGEWPVYSDPKLNLDRIVAGCYADPPFDEEGILRFSIGGVAVQQPGTIALCALNGFHGLLGSDASHDYPGIFRRHAVWLRRHLDVDEHGVGRWWYAFVPPRAKRREAGAWHFSDRQSGPRWVSCFAQAFGLSILLRAFQRSGDTAYREAADAAARSFTVPLESFGVQYQEGDRLYFEEYPEKKPAHVLNGFLSAILSLEEYARSTGAGWARELCTTAVQTAIEILPRYEAPHGLKYDLGNDALANDDYVTFILIQLEALERVTGIRELGRVARRWRRQRYGRLLRAGSRAVLERLVTRG